MPKEPTEDELREMWADEVARLRSNVELFIEEEDGEDLALLETAIRDGVIPKLH